MFGTLLMTWCLKLKMNVGFAEFAPFKRLWAMTSLHFGNITQRVSVMLGLCSVFAELEIVPNLPKYYSRFVKSQ